MVASNALASRMHEVRRNGGRGGHKVRCVGGWDNVKWGNERSGRVRWYGVKVGLV